MMSSLSCRLVAAVALLITANISAFQAPMPRSSSVRLTNPVISLPAARIAPAERSTTALSMYELPPGGGGGKNDNEFGAIVSGALTIGAIVLFFASPLGGIFFAITNSLFLLALITPVALFIAFQVWQSMNTVAGPCPNCGAEARVIKDVSQPSICFSCGSILQVSPDLAKIELSTPTSREAGGFVDMDQPGAGMGGGGASIFDIFGGETPGQPNPAAEATKPKEQQQFKRDATIVDVEVTKDD